MTAIDVQRHGAEPTDHPDVEFGRSKDGLSVARIGDLVFALVAGRDGECLLASARRVQRPLADLKRGDFYSHHGAIAGEVAFRARMVEQAQHCRELTALDRQTVRINRSTPWGPSQGATIYAEGVVAHTTARHGGFKLSRERDTEVDPKLRGDGGWYEEDDQWAIVAITFPELFTTYERKLADRTFRDKWPEEWERLWGRALQPGESRRKDQQAFERENSSHWIVVSALRSDHHAEMTEVIAVLGGKQHYHAEERRFLVPNEEYSHRGGFGFVIDEARHAAYDGPSSFVSWQGRMS